MENDLSHHVMRAFKSLYWNYIGKIRAENVRKITAGSYQGVKERCLILPVLLNFYFDEAIRRWLNLLQIHFIVDGVDSITILFTDDQIIIGHSENES